VAISTIWGDETDYGYSMKKSGNKYTHTSTIIVFLNIIHRPAFI
jgi:hypothetical protein